jgi:hypothetical protein
MKVLGRRGKERYVVTVLLIWTGFNVTGRPKKRRDV